MLLSKQQRYVLDVLRRLGCARKNQLEALLKARFSGGKNRAFSWRHC